MTNLYFGLAMIPYLVFDVAGYIAGALTPFGAIGDAVGNLIFTTCCYIGYKDGDESGGVNDEEKKKQFGMYKQDRITFIINMRKIFEALLLNMDTNY